MTFDEYVSNSTDLYKRQSIEDKICELNSRISNISDGLDMCYELDAERGYVLHHLLLELQQELEWMEKLNQLVSMDTPMRPIEVSVTFDGRVGKCPACGRVRWEMWVYGIEHHCVCGQRLDWGNTDENCNK